MIVRMKNCAALAMLLVMVLLTAAKCENRDIQLAKLSSYLASGIQATISTQELLAKDGIITPEENFSMGQALLQVNRDGAIFNNWLIQYRANKATADMTQLQQLLSGIQNGTRALAISLHVKNPQAQQRLEIVAKTITLALNLAIELQKGGGIKT